MHDDEMTRMAVMGWKSQLLSNCWPSCRPVEAVPGPLAGDGGASSSLSGDLETSVLLTHQRSRSVDMLSLQGPLHSLVGGRAEPGRGPAGTWLMVGVDDVELLPRGFPWQVLRCGVGCGLSTNTFAHRGASRAGQARRGNRETPLRGSYVRGDWFWLYDLAASDTPSRMTSRRR
jgi:hypothetical protein